MTPEALVKEDVKKGLEDRGIPYFMPVQMGYGKRGVDFYCALPPCGHSLLIETKRLDYKGKLTKAQRDVLIANAKAGGLSVVALCFADVVNAVALYDPTVDGLFIDYNVRGMTKGRTYALRS
jgi:hypothetical protein